MYHADFLFKKLQNKVWLIIDNLNLVLCLSQADELFDTVIIQWNDIYVYIHFTYVPTWYFWHWPTSSDFL